MKIVLIILSIFFLVFIIIQIFAMRGQRKIETYPYEVIKKYNTFEIRNYAASLFTSVKLTDKGYKNVSSKGFRILAGYIFGGNDKNEKIAMTSPVAISLEDSMTVMFMVPKKNKKESLPTPNQSEIEFKEMPAKKMAAISFGGWANDERIEKYKAKLIIALAAEGIVHTNRFYFFGYNPPYEVINRKNELIVELPN
jgi:hypothetical protein